MKSGWDFPPDGEPGGGASASNKIDGSYRGRTLPSWLDPNNIHGELTVLRLQPVDPAKLPENPGVVSTSVTSCCGPIEGAFPENRGTRYVLKVRRLEQVTKLKAMKELLDKTPITIDEHPVHNFVKCVIHCREVVNLTEQAVHDLLAEQGISSVRRITRKGNGDERVNTPMLILTVTGTIVPQHVYLGFIRVKTRPFYPAPMQCYKCWDFGHTKLRCTKKEVCGTCSGDHLVVRGVFCFLPSQCYKCQTTEHGVSSRRCPLYVAENDIAKIRVDFGLSYDAAKRNYDQQKKKELARKGDHGTGNDQRFLEFTKRMEGMEERLNKKDQEMAKQQKEWERRFEEQQDELDRQRKERDYYQNLYEVTKKQFDEMQGQYYALIRENCKGNKYIGLPAPPTDESCSQLDKSNNKDIQEKQQQPKPRRSRSRSRSSKQKKSNRSRGRSSKRSRSSGKSSQQSPKRSRSPIDQNSNNLANEKLPKQKHIQNKNAYDSNVPSDLISGSSEDDSNMQN